MNVLLVGLGRWGANYLRILRSLPVALDCADTDQARLDAPAKSGFPAERTSRALRLLRVRVIEAVLASAKQGRTLSLEA